MISQSVEYALRAVVTVAQQADRPITAQEISTITHVPGPYLSKLMQGLVRARIVSSQRGPRGGFVLAKPPGDLSIWDVVDAVEPFQRILECPLGITSHGSALCPLHRRLDQAMAIVEEQFRQTSVGDLLSDPGNVTPLCEEQKVFSLDSSGGRQRDANRVAKK